MTESQTVATPAAPARRPRRGGAAALVAMGILLSRLAGLVRQRVFAHYLGTSPAADAYSAAWKIPNAMQYLLGEGVLSASFIPVYAALEARPDPESKRAARAVAGSTAGLLLVVTSAFALLGILATPLLIDLIAPGFKGETRALTIELVRIFFPAIALLVASAFCIGVLNSHRRFFLSYAAPVVFSAATIVALVAAGHAGRSQARIAVWMAWGAIAGGLLQLAVQLPLVVRFLGGTRSALAALGFGRGDPHVREVVRNFGPVIAGRGVVQISAYVDQMIATYLPTGSVAALLYAQTLYMLPISLFGMAISAAALPSMSAAHGLGEEVSGALRGQLERGLRQIAFYVVPTVAAFLALGDVTVAALFQNGRFGTHEVRFVWGILAGSTVGLLAATMGRLYSSTFYALRDTRTPLKFAAIRVVLTASLGIWWGLFLPAELGVPRLWGAAGLTASAGVAGWIEFALLRREIHRRIGAAHFPPGFLARLWGAAAAAAGLAYGLARLLAHAPRLLRSPIPRAGLVLGLFGATYLGLLLILQVPEAKGALQRFRRR